ncbi:MAG: hypothetical protein N4A49_03035 [Marinifilaceae bacterium]|jgi:hypothetical protein|nr:hypothetical protein [Marinifilaceae bacterium]
MYKFYDKIIFILLWSLLPISNKAQELKSFEKTLNYSYELLSKNKLFKLNNEYGDISILKSDNDKIELKCILTTKSYSKEEAELFFNRLKFEERISKYNSVIVNSGLGRFDFNLNDFQIDYLIYIPEKIKIEINNKYGDIFINDVSNQIEIKIEYGNISCPSINNMISDIDLKYSSLKIGKANNMTIKSEFSRISIESINNLDINSSNSFINIQNSKDSNISTHRDLIKFGESENLNLPEAISSNIQIGKINSSIKLKNTKSNFLIKDIADKLKDLSIINENGNGVIFVSNINLINRYFMLNNSIASQSEIDTEEIDEIQLRNDGKTEDSIETNSFKIDNFHIINKAGNIDIIRKKK